MIQGMWKVVLGFALGTAIHFLLAQPNNQDDYLELYNKYIGGRK
jgi:hypothetical protein